MEATDLSTLPKPSSFPYGGLEIMLKTKLIIDEKHDDILKQLRELIEENYDPRLDSSQYAVIFSKSLINADFFT